MRSAFIVFAILFAPGLVDSCGPFTEYAQFSTYKGPLPDELAKGELGVLRPTFYRAQLVLAWRAMSGVNYVDRQEPAPVRRKQSIVESSAQPFAFAGISRSWLEVRSTVPGVPALSNIEVDKKLPGDNNFEVFPNCLAGAFDTAAKTLASHIAQWGLKSSETAGWVKAQDQVFENCAAGPVIPEALSQANTLQAADRAYQIAAAEFYAGEYPKAEEEFDRIAADKSSPWHEIAPYIAARACIRQFTIDGDRDKMKLAETRLKAIDSDSARDLLGFVQGLLYPQDRLVQLGKQASELKPGDQLDKAITDYTWIWDRLEAAKEPLPADRSEITDWIYTFQSGDKAFEKWKAKPTLPWLLAALIWTQPGVPDLVKAAHDIASDSVAWPTATYYGILSEIHSGHQAAARQWADEALNRKPAGSFSNLLRAERLSLAHNWTEFMTFAPRMPVAYGWDEPSDDPIESSDKKRNRPAFDDDATPALNTTVPLTLWLDAAQNKLIPGILQIDIAQAAWVRAIILNDPNTARSIAQRLVLLKPELTKPMTGYLAESDPQAAHFDAIFLMLHAPGFEPQVRSGWGRETPILKNDQLRDNWWNLTPRSSPSETHPDLPEPRGFLTDNQLREGKAQWAQIVERAPVSGTYLCSETVAWANAHPQDPRLPEALHLAVNAVHYGPADQSTKPWSKRAFDLLHSKFPTSPWTAQTPYWY